MSYSRMALLALPILVIFLAINRVDQLFWTYFLSPPLFYGDSRGGAYIPPMVGSQSRIRPEEMIGSVGFSEEPRNDASRKSSPLESRGRQTLVLSGTTFFYDGFSCRLLGVQESADPIKHDQAKEFARFWFDKFSDFSVRNERAPLVESGVSVLWIGHPSGEWSHLSEELVQAGLVTFDRSSNQDYSF